MKGADLIGVIFKSDSTFAYLGDLGKILTGTLVGEGVVGAELEVLLDSVPDSWRCGDVFLEEAGVMGSLHC
jgi:hypothetical protein